MKINSIEDFNKFSEKFQKEHVMPFAYAIGLTFEDSQSNYIASKWFTINKKENLGTAAVLMDVLEIKIKSNLSSCFIVTDGLKAEIALNIMLNEYFHVFENDGNYHSNIIALQHTKRCLSGIASFSVIFYPQEETLLNCSVQNVGDAHFRLSAMSQLKYKPNTLCLDKMFDVLPNLVWTPNGVFTVTDWNKKAWLSGSHITTGTDKIPLLTWGAPIPPGVRIANPQTVRLGAYLSPGTTIMHYGFVNFNAGTLGKSMVEGRISAGTTIDDGTDIGAGAGFLGTLSGGNSLKLSAGKDCLIGANAECGVVLGDNCVVATGTCFSQNTPITEVLPDGQEIIGKVKDYNGKDNLTYRRNATSGQLEVIHKGNKAILNETLHTKQ